jgi:lysophospholipase L1-like esterase
MIHGGQVALLLALGLLAAGCGAPSGKPPESDDAGVADATDASRQDAGLAIDAGARDSGAEPDAAVPSCQPSDFHVSGRTDDSDPGGPRFEWSGTEIRAKFTGTLLSVKLLSGAFFDVAVDGVARARLEADWRSAPYAVASGLVDATHEVLLHQRSEAFYEPSQLLGFETQSGRGLVPSTYCPTRRIEFIGDSITCGYGVEGANQSCDFSQETENHDLAYAALAARALAAEAHTVAWSGKGVFRNGDGKADETIPVLWSRTIPTDGASHWDFARWTPDVVVINLGTNDFAMGIPAKSDFNGAYGRFLDDLRSRYPRAFIFVAIGPMLDGAELGAIHSDLTELVALRRTSGETRIALIEFAAQNVAVNGAGCDWHPSAKTQQLMADQLVPAVRQAVGW